MWSTGWGKCLGSGTNSRRSADVEYWMGQVSGEWDEQQKIGRCIGGPSRLQHPKTDKQKRDRPSYDLKIYFFIA